MRGNRTRGFGRIFKLLLAVIIIWLVVWVGFLISTSVQETPERKRNCPVYSSEINVFSNFSTKYGQYFPGFQEIDQSDDDNKEGSESKFIGMNEIKVLLLVHIYKQDRVKALEETWLGTFRTHYPNVKIVTFSSEIRDPEKTEKFIHTKGAVAKLVEIIKYIHEKYPGYDFYLKFDDDAYVYPHRLMHLLTYTLQSKIRTTEPYYGGFKGVYQNKFEFLCGGSGYVFNGAAYDKLKGCKRPGGGDMYEDVFFSRWMHEVCGIPYTFFTAFLLGWPEIIMKNFDVDKFTKNRFTLDLPITYHYVTPFEMTHFLETKRVIPKIVYSFDDVHSVSHQSTNDCFKMISRSNQEIEDLATQRKKEFEEKTEIQKHEFREALETENRLLSPSEKQKKFIQTYRDESPYQYIVSNFSHALRTSKSRFPELVSENRNQLITTVGNYTIVNPVLKFMLLYNTGGILINPKIDCDISLSRNIIDDILVIAYELGKDVVVYIDQRVDEIMFIATVERADAMLLILRDSLFEDQFSGFDFGEKHFRRLFHFYGDFMEEKVLMLSNVNNFFVCEGYGEESTDEIHHLQE